MIVEQKRTSKSWGQEIIWSSCQKFVGKILCIKTGHKLSKHYHESKEETIFVLSGTLLLETGMGESLIKKDLRKGQSYHIVPGTVHRFSAAYGDVELIEVSTPELEDAVRLEND